MILEILTTVISSRILVNNQNLEIIILNTEKYQNMVGHVVVNCAFHTVQNSSSQLYQSDTIATKYTPLHSKLIRRLQYTVYRDFLSNTSVIDLLINNTYNNGTNRIIEDSVSIEKANIYEEQSTQQNGILGQIFDQSLNNLQNDESMMQIIKLNSFAHIIKKSKIGYNHSQRIQKNKSNIQFFKQPLHQSNYCKSIKYQMKLELEICVKTSLYDSNKLKIAILQKLIPKFAVSIEDLKIKTKSNEFVVKLSFEKLNFNLAQEAKKLQNSKQKIQNISLIEKKMMHKKQTCPPTTPYENGGCFAVRNCGQQMVWQISQWKFTCEPCQVFVTGYNSYGQLGDGTLTSVNGFKNVSQLCFDKIWFKERTSLAVVGNSTFWAGLEDFVLFPKTEQTKSTFQTLINNGQYGFSRNNLINMSNQQIRTSGFNLQFCLGTETAINGYDGKKVLIGFLMGQTVKQVGGTQYTSFIVTQSAIYSTNSSSSNESGERIQLSPYWGLMLIPIEIKIILKAQFFPFNVVLTDQNHNFYANGFNGGSQNQLCYSGQATRTFVLLGKIKHISLYNNFALLVNPNNQLEICGKLQMLDVLFNSENKTILAIPNGELVDISVQEYGAIILVDYQATKNIYYIGRSNSNYQDIGIGQSNSQNWTKITTIDAQNCSSFVQSSHFNNALIYGCSSLKPFRWNGICYENCTFYVSYVNGVEQCVEKSCSFSIIVSLSIQRNWSVCIDCEKLDYDVNQKLICRQNCHSDQLTYHLEISEFFCVDSEAEVYNYTQLSDIIFDETHHKLCKGGTPYVKKPDRSCHEVMDCGELMVWNISQWTFSCESCQVFVTGYNVYGQLGDGSTSNVNGFKNVSNLCFEQIQLTQYTSLAILQNKTSWAGMDNYLIFPYKSVYIKEFLIQNQTSHFGISLYSLISLTNGRVSSQGYNSQNVMGTDTLVNNYDAKLVQIGFLKGQVVKQVGGTRATSFIVCQSAIYSTSSAIQSENGERIQVSPFWGQMIIPNEIKIILKAQFQDTNVILVDQNHVLYVNGYNINNMLCFIGPNTKFFVTVGQLKHMQLFMNFAFLINKNNQLEICGRLTVFDKTFNTAIKTLFEIPAGKLIDVSTSRDGANILIENNGQKSVYYVGKSYSSWDIGVSQTTAQNWTNITTVNAQNCSSFAILTSYYNNALIYGCSRLQPFRYNGICYENCSFTVYYTNGIERCSDKECNQTIKLQLEYPRNWSICIECQYNHFDLNGLLICRQDCLPTQITYQMDNNEFFCVDSESEINLYTNIVGKNYYNCNFYYSTPEKIQCQTDIDCGQLLLLLISNNNFTCATSVDDPIFSSSKINDYLWIKNSSEYVKTKSCPLNGCVSNNICSLQCPNKHCEFGTAFLYGDGFICNFSTCQYYKVYNLSKNSFVCQKQRCASLNISVFNIGFICINNLSQIDIPVTVLNEIIYLNHICNFKVYRIENVQYCLNIECSANTQIRITLLALSCFELPQCGQVFSETCLLSKEQINLCDVVTQNQNYSICVIQNYNLEDVKMQHFIEQKSQTKIICKVGEMIDQWCIPEKVSFIQKNFERQATKNSAFGTKSIKDTNCTMQEAQTCDNICAWQFDAKNGKCISNERQKEKFK